MISIKSFRKITAKFFSEKQLLICLFVEMSQKMYVYVKQIKQIKTKS